jgi:transposase
MTEGYDGRQVVGMDLHRRRSVLVRMTEDGRKLETVRITNSAAALRAVIARAGKNARVVIEATYGWYWAVDVLEAAGAEVHLAHPLGVKAYSYRRVKNDERDASDLADLLRMGRLPDAWIAPAEIRELREISRYRHQLVKARTSLKDQVHGVLAKLGTRSRTRTSSGCTGRRGWMSSAVDAERPDVLVAEAGRLQRYPQHCFDQVVLALEHLAGGQARALGPLDEHAPAIGQERHTPAGRCGS